MADGLNLTEIFQKKKLRGTKITGPRSLPSQHWNGAQPFEHCNIKASNGEPLWPESQAEISHQQGKMYSL